MLSVIYNGMFRERSLFMDGEGGGGGEGTRGEGQKFRDVLSWRGQLFWKGNSFFNALFLQTFFAKVTLHVL